MEKNKHVQIYFVFIFLFILFLRRFIHPVTQQPIEN